MGLFSRGESRAERRDREFHESLRQNLDAWFEEQHAAMNERDRRRQEAYDRRNGR